MMKHYRGFSSLVILLVVIGIIILAAGGLSLANKKSQSTQNVATTSPVAAKDAAKTKVPDSISKYQNAELKFSFSYSSFWSLEDDWDKGYLTFWHTESAPTHGEAFNKGNSKIEVMLDNSYGSTDVTLDKPVKTVIAGQSAYSSIGDGTGIVHIYWIELPSRPGMYLRFTLYGDAPVSRLDQVVQTLAWQ